MTLEFRVLGEVVAEARGQALDVGHARQRLVLAALLVEGGRVVPTEQLVTRVWGENIPSRVANALQTYMARLRRVLEPHGGRIERRSGGYVIPLPNPEVVDLHRFTDLVGRARKTVDEAEAAGLFERALDLWRGEALLGLESPWAEVVRQGLARQRITAELAYADLQLRRGLHSEMLSMLMMLAAEHPLDERIAGTLMRALHRSGRQDEALAHFRLVRAGLSEELGADPSPELCAVHEEILAAQTSRPTPPRSSAAPVPQQLAPSPAHFAGRDDELARLTAQLGHGRTALGAVPIVVLHGGGGMGKTALALRWAHSQADAFPDGRLYVDLRGFAPEGAPTPSGVALRGFLHALGVAGSALPAEFDAQVALYRTLVAGKRMLIVLDNARDSAQVTPLLPGDASCAVVVTSRDRMTGLTTAHGAVALPVRPLPAPHARAVLATWLGAGRLAAESDAVEELIARCAGSPLALGILAGRAAEHPEFPLANLVAELRDVSTALGALDDGEPGASLLGVLSWSQRALPPQHAEVFALLGLVPGPDISVLAAANLTGLAPARTMAVLRALERASLVEQDAPGRYRMHDLVGLYARERAEQDLTPQVCTAALHRLTDFYTHTATAGNRILHPHGILPGVAEPGAGHPHPHDLTGDEAVMDWFDAEHDCLLDVQRLASARGWHRPVWQLAWALTAYHYRRGFLHEDLAMWPLSIAAAEALGDRDVQIMAHRRLGLTCARCKRHREAFEHLDQARRLADEAGDARVQAIIEHDLAQAAEHRGDNATALRHEERSLELFLPLGNPVWEAQARNGVGWYLTHLGRHDEARAQCETALELYRAESHSAVADVLDSLGHIAHHTGRHADAVEHYREALALYRQAGNAYIEADTLERLGRTHLAMGSRGEARAVWQLALDLYRTQGRLTEAGALDDELRRLHSGSDAPGTAR